MKVNRGCVAYIENKEITIYSYDTINKIIDNPLSVINDTLIFKTTKELSQYLYNRAKNNNEVNLKINSAYLPNYYLVDVNLILEYKNSYEDDKMEDNYIIKQCQDNKQITNEELLQNLSKIFNGNFVILKDNNYCIVHRENSKDYYYKEDININDSLYDRIKCYLRELHESNNDKIKEKLGFIIKSEFENDLKENNYKINNLLWKELDMDCKLEVVY